jgi:dienelactone hydrolase
VALPIGFVRGFPAPWLGALAGILLLANVGVTIGPLPMFIPAGALGPYVVLTGIVTALAFAARRMLSGGRETGGATAARAGSATWRRACAALLVGTALVVGGGGTVVLVSPGSSGSLVPADPSLDGTVPPVPAGLPDPGAPGSHGVRAVSYGSGTDRLRPEFGAGVTVRTPTIDASGALAPLGWGADEARQWFWGFGRDGLPLNGLAWLPDGEGPFPLVLMVHGNHAMGDFSEPGYGYLGQHLASRGFVAVSVDEDFLNGSWASDWGGREQVVRAWLLLLHLDQWRTWNADPASPFHGLVDLDRVALVGHSRGGEAASVAASLAGRSASPEPGVDPWPVGLSVRAVVAIAPSDGQYSRGPVVLQGTDLLTLQGGHDSDATSWMGIRQYARTVIEDGGFRAALWSYRSNHGQFNTTWGRSDHGPLGGAILNLAPLLDAMDQEDVARTAIGAFLEASLHGEIGYRNLFRRPMVGRSWLPADDIYLVRSSDDAFVALTTGDPSRGIEGVEVSATGFTRQRAMALPLRALLPDQGTRAVELTWSGAGPPAAWEIHGIEDAVATAQPVAIQVSLANGALDATADAAPLDLLVELSTTDGVTVALPRSRWGALPPPLKVQLVKDELLAALSSMDLARGAPVERVLQTYEIPLADYAAADPRFRPDRLSAMRLVVDGRTPGCLWVAEAGLVAST